MTSHLVDPQTLVARLAEPNPPLLLDVRWSLGGPPGRGEHLAGHFPGAVFVDLETELAALPSAAAGRHPLPAVEDLQVAARRWGLREGQAVVVHDATGAMAAARAWWLLRWAGVADVRVLDGGVPAWVRAGYPLETGEVTSTPGDVVLRGGQLPVLDADGAAALARAGVLLDARAGERFRGETEPIDPRAGHIPGARSAPTTQNLTADGTFLAPDALAARAGGLVGASTQVGVYCGSGVTAAHAALALAEAGVEAVLYPGSWSQWSADVARPVETDVARPVETDVARPVETGDGSDPAGDVPTSLG